MHILPRKKDDFKRDNEIYEHLQHHDKEGSQFSKPPRDATSMANEARELRKLFYS